MAKHLISDEQVAMARRQAASELETRAGLANVSDKARKLSKARALVREALGDDCERCKAPGFIAFDKLCAPCGALEVARADLLLTSRNGFAAATGESLEHAAARILVEQGATLYAAIGAVFNLAPNDIADAAERKAVGRFLRRLAAERLADVVRVIMHVESDLSHATSAEEAQKLHEQHTELIALQKVYERTGAEADFGEPPDDDEDWEAVFAEESQRAADNLAREGEQDNPD